MNSWPWSLCRKISMRRSWPVRRPVVVRSMTWLLFNAARVASLKELSGAIARSSRLNRPGRSPAGQGLCTHVNRSMARVSPYELGNVAAFVYEAAKGLTGRVVESTAEVSQPRPPAGQWSRRGGVTHSSRHDRALPRAVTRLPIELAIVSLEQVCLVLYQ